MATIAAAFREGYGAAGDAGGVQNASDWKAALLIALPVFYRSLRTFLRRVREITAGGMRLSVDSENVSSIPPLKATDSENDPEPKV